MLFFFQQLLDKISRLRFVFLFVNGSSLGCEPQETWRGLHLPNNILNEYENPDINWDFSQPDTDIF